MTTIKLEQLNRELEDFRDYVQTYTNMYNKMFDTLLDLIDTEIILVPTKPFPPIRIIPSSKLVAF